jgi:hypothetical protein
LYVSFKDLEIEPKRGSVGLIMDINEIEVTPSRESPMWTTKTRAAVLAKYKKVSEMASVYLNKELSSETDYLKWIVKAAQIIGSMRQGGSNSSVLSRLASIIDMDDIGSVTYPCDSRILFEPKAKVMLGDTLTVRTVKYNSNMHKVERKIVDDLGHLTKRIYFTNVGSNPLKDRYLYEEYSDFVLINVKADGTPDAIGNLVLASTLLLDYDNVVIPQDRMDLYLSEAGGISEDDGGAVAKSAPAIDWSAQRKVNKQIPVHVLSGEGTTYSYKFTPEDIYITELYSKFADKLIVYTTGGDREALSDLLAMFPKHMLATWSVSSFNEFTASCTHMELPTTNRILGVLLAAENVKYIKNSTKYMSMADLVVKRYDPKSGHLTFSDLIKFAATNSVLNTLYKDKFPKIHSGINHKYIKATTPKLYELARFFDDNYRSYAPPVDLMGRKGFLHNAILIQLYKEKILDASDETVEDLFKEINTQVPDAFCDVIDSIEDIDILNIDVIKKVLKVFDYYSGHKFLLHLLVSFNDYNGETINQMKPQITDYFKYANNDLT